MQRKGNFILFQTLSWIVSHGFDKKKYFKTTNRYFPDWDDTNIHYKYKNILGWYFLKS